MARGKDAPTQSVTVDPYVQQSLLRGKEQANSRLIAAMQQAATTQRQRQAGTQSAVMQGAQMAQQRQMMAAQMEQQDKRAAEAERARREDMEFAKAMQESQQIFQAEQAVLEREYQQGIRRDDREYLEKLDDKRDALRRFEFEKQTAAQERNTNALLSIVKASLNRETAKEKAQTTIKQEADKFDEDKDMYERTVSRTRDAASLDERMNYPVEKTTWEKMKSLRGKRKEIISPWKALTDITPLQSMYRAGKVVYEERQPNTANPIGVLQDQLDKFQTNISVEQMAPEKIRELEDAIQSGDISPISIRNALGVVNGMTDVIKEKSKEYTEKDEIEYRFWKDTYREMTRMRDAVESLQYSTKKITGSEYETVGSRINHALGIINNSSPGGQASRLRELMGNDYGKILDEMTKSIQVPKLWEVTPEMTEYEKEIRTKENNMLTRLYPNLIGGGI